MISMKAKAEKCDMCGQPRHGLVKSYYVTFGGPSLRYWEAETGRLCPKCRSRLRDVLRTDRAWTDSEAKEVERIHWEKNYGGDESDYR